MHLKKGKSSDRNKGPYLNDHFEKRRKNINENEQKHSGAGGRQL